VDLLRHLAGEASRHEKTGQGWRGFLFASFDDFSIAEPERIFHPIFRYPDGAATVSLLEPLVSLPPSV